MTTPSLPETVNRLGRDLRRDVLPILGRIPAYGRLIYALATDNTLPNSAKSALFLALGYQVSPVDLIPGFIPVIGQLDDVLVMLWGIRRTLDQLAPERAAEHLTKVKVSREQIDADAATVRRALESMVASGARAAGRGITTLLRVGVTAGVYLGYLGYYTLMGAANRRR